MVPVVSGTMHKLNLFVPYGDSLKFASGGLETECCIALSNRALTNEETNVCTRLKLEAVARHFEGHALCCCKFLGSDVSTALILSCADSFLAGNTSTEYMGNQ